MTCLLEGGAEIFETVAEDLAALGSVLLRMGIAGGLGAVVAGLYRYSCRGREGAPGLAVTLVLLSMLICMIMMSVGGNIAGAFTLVGTLAIVRFRTAVRDTRDTAFVIFAVGVGMACSSGAIEIALGGTVAVGLAVILLTRWDRSVVGDPDQPDRAELELRLDPSTPDPTVVNPVIARHAKAHRLRSSGIRNPGKPMIMVWSVVLTDPTDSPKLISELTAIEGITRAIVTFDDD